jgi:hypothetical protein
MQTRNGDTQTKFKITGLKAASISPGGSGHILPGNYVMKIRNFSIVDKTDGKAGKNYRAEFVTIEPKPFAGVPIHMYGPAPTGENEDVGLQQIRNIILSNATFKGTLAKVTGESEGTANGELELNGEWFKGRHVAARLEDGTGQYSNRSQVANFLSKEDYEVAPGPSGGTQRSSTDSKPQSKTPEVAG